MTWTGQTFSLNQILTSTQMNNLQADITAQANGDSGAPQQQTAGIADLAVIEDKLASSSVTEDKIGFGAVTEDKIGGFAVTVGKLASGCVQTSKIANGQVTLGKMATDSVDSVNILAGAVHVTELDISQEEVVSSGASSTLMSTGGYGFSPQIKNSSGSTDLYQVNNGLNGQAVTVGTSYETYLYLNDSAATGTTTARVLYVTASPPYDLGDGEVKLFVWLRLNSSNEIKTIVTSKTPPWIYNGPTNVVADRTALVNNEIKKYKTIYDFSEEDGVLQKREIEIDNEMKNRDMPLLPHPFALREPGDRVVLLDPMNTEYLSEIMDSGGSIGEIIMDDYIRLNNSPLSRGAPPGVTPSRFIWKNTVKRYGEVVSDRKRKSP